MIEHQTVVVDILGQPEMMELRAPDVPDPDFWLVVAYYAPGGWWKTFPGPGFPSRDAAGREARSLPGCYSRRIIVHVGGVP